jgi:hypothetical protein
VDNFVGNSVRQAANARWTGDLSLCPESWHSEKPNKIKGIVAKPHKRLSDVSKFIGKAEMCISQVLTSIFCSCAAFTGC